MLKRKFQNAFQITLVSLLFIVIAYLGSINSKELYASLKKPYFSPVETVFGSIWPLLYILMIVATIMIDSKSLSGIYKKDALGTFWLQLILNSIWPYLFFVFQMYLFAFIWFILLLFFAFLTMVRYYKLNKLAGALLFPYFIWLIYAAYLNLFIWLLN